VDVPHPATIAHERVRLEDRQNGQFERNVKNLPARQQSKTSQKACGIIDVLDYINAKNDVIRVSRGFKYVLRTKVHPIRLSAFAQQHRLGRHFVADKIASWISRAQLRQNSAGAAPNFSDPRRLQTVLSHHCRNLLGFPGRILDVPRRVLRQIFPVALSGFHNQTPSA
jgi:hypothetical protein